MSTVTVSPKFQVVIPKEVREMLDLEPGQRIAISVEDGIILLIPVADIGKLEGFLPGLDTAVEREPDRV